MDNRCLVMAISHLGELHTAFEKTMCKKVIQIYLNEFNKHKKLRAL